MNKDAAEFIVKGKSALAKFVLQASPLLRAGDEVLLVDSSSKLLGVGKAVLNGTEMLAFKRGVAVNTRHARES